MYSRTRTILFGGLSAIVLTAATSVVSFPAMAIDFPCRAARLIVPSNAGGGTDTVMRVFVDAVNRQGATPTIQVVNIGGQATIRGATEARAAAPDGCTLNVAHESLMLTYLTGQNDFTYTAFEPVAILTFDPGVVGAGGKAPFNTFPEMIDAAKSQELLAGVSIGGTSHFSLLAIQQQAGVQFKYVSYDGARERLTAILSDNVHFGEVNIPQVRQYQASGEVKPLAILSNERSRLLPDLPSINEFGIDLKWGLTHALFMPQGTPAEILSHYADLFGRAARDPELIERFAKGGTEVEFVAGEEAKKVLDTNFDVMKSLARDLGIYSGK